MLWLGVPSRLNISFRNRLDFLCPFHFEMDRICSAHLSFAIDLHAIIADMDRPSSVASDYIAASFSSPKCKLHMDIKGYDVEEVEGDLGISRRRSRDI